MRNLRNPPRPKPAIPSNSPQRQLSTNKRRPTARRSCLEYLEDRGILPTQLYVYFSMCQPSGETPTAHPVLQFLLLRRHFPIGIARALCTRKNSLTIMLIYVEEKLTRIVVFLVFFNFPAHYLGHFFPGVWATPPNSCHRQQTKK